MWLLTATCVLAACGGNEFTSNAGGSGGAAANAGTSNGGSDHGGSANGGMPSGGATAHGGMPSGGTTAHGGGGAGGNGGTAGHGGSTSAGAGGKTSTDCATCAAGTYCQDGVNRCRPCADFTRLQFAAPEKLATVSQTEAGDERFPRPGVTSSDLFYRSGKPGFEQIWYDANPVSGPGQSITPAAPPNPLMQPAASGALYAPNKITPQNLFFDHFDVATNSRQIMLASWPASDLSNAQAAPPPLNGMGDNYSIAIAGDVKRAYWMSTRNAKGAQLFWSDISSGTATDPEVLSLTVGSQKCPLSGDDATPWVDPAGSVLLFRSVSVDDNCLPNDSGGYDLFAAPLSKDTGLATTSGIPLSALNIIGGGSNETDPAFSADACFIYYASDNGSADYDIYRAARN